MSEPYHRLGTGYFYNDAATRWPRIYTTPWHPDDPWHTVFDPITGNDHAISIDEVYWHFNIPESDGEAKICGIESNRGMVFQYNSYDIIIEVQLTIPTWGTGKKWTMRIRNAAGTRWIQGQLSTISCRCTVDDTSYAGGGGWGIYGSSDVQVGDLLTMRITLYGGGDIINFYANASDSSTSNLPLESLPFSAGELLYLEMWGEKNTADEGDYNVPVSYMRIGAWFDGPDGWACFGTPGLHTTGEGFYLGDKREFNLSSKCVMTATNESSYRVGADLEMTPDLAGQSLIEENFEYPRTPLSSTFYSYYWHIDYSLSYPNYLARYKNPLPWRDGGTCYFSMGDTAYGGAPGLTNERGTQWLCPMIEYDSTLKRRYLVVFSNRGEEWKYEFGTLTYPNITSINSCLFKLVVCNGWFLWEITLTGTTTQWNTGWMSLYDYFGVGETVYFALVREPISDDAIFYSDQGHFHISIPSLPESGENVMWCGWDAPTMDMDMSYETEAQVCYYRTKIINPDDVTDPDSLRGINPDYPSDAGLPLKHKDTCIVRDRYNRIYYYALKAGDMADSLPDTMRVNDQLYWSLLEGISQDHMIVEQYDIVGLVDTNDVIITHTQHDRSKSYCPSVQVLHNNKILTHGITVSVKSSTEIRIATVETTVFTGLKINLYITPI